MEIKILGGGCPRCAKLEKTAREAAQELGIDAGFTKIKNMTKIMEYDILETPALVINEEVKSFGRLPAKEEIMEWMTAAK
jgi:small redox-active disulfide protein 2